MTDMSNPTEQDCLRESIHLSGAIQPHGYLVSCGRTDWVVRHVSANVEALFGVPPEELLGKPLSEYMAEDVLHAIGDAISGEDATGVAQRACTSNIGYVMTVCDITAHVADDMVHVELEPQAFRVQERAPTSVAQSMVAQMGMGGDAGGFFQRTAEQVQLLTGYDRVMVYRFREDDSGEVITESCRDGMEPFLGLRYPATDIPPQARRLYLRNRIRVIPDASYSAVPIVPPLRPGGEPLDLSQHVLRSVSPIHLEYLGNMGVVASMSISIVSGGRLWGLIACHHGSPKPLTAGVRAAADLFGMFVSMRVAAREQERTMQRYESAQRVHEKLSQRLSRAPDFGAALVGELDAIQALLESDGSAAWLDGQWHTCGRAPASRNPQPLLDWLQRIDSPSIAMTDTAADWNPPALGAPGLAGVLAINLGSPADWLFLFRIEQVEQVRWAGEPKKALVVTDDGQRIAPRKSFATWRETVRGRSVGWSASDQRGALRIQRVLREHRGRRLVHARDSRDQEHRHLRQRLHDQKLRLGDAAALLEGLVHVGEHDAARISERIDRLEEDLRALMGRSGLRQPSPLHDASDTDASRGTGTVS
ncbi:MAG: GAF domain-containing protein [Lysobacter spongiicola]|nr:GAF domain-containing protein [Lysobacter spongiicola]